MQEEDFAPLFRNSLIMALLIIAGGWLFIRLQNRPLLARDGGWLFVDLDHDGGGPLRLVVELVTTYRTERWQW